VAKAAREYVWLECTECGAKNYRTPRAMGQPQVGKKIRPPACMDNNRLSMKKFCRRERRHTLHKESRKK